MENMGDWEQRNLIYELTQGRELAKQLQLHLNAPSSSQETLESLLQRIQASYEKALSILKWNTSVAMEVQTAGLATRTVEAPLSPRSGSSRSEDSDRDNKDPEMKDTPKKRRTLPTPRWTQLVPVTPGTPLEVLLDDGFTWRKYGQKDILGAKHPRGYYRCAHRNAQGCLATKQVQRSDEDPLIFEITYHGSHTCTQAVSSSQILPSSSQENQNQDTNLINQQQSQNNLPMNLHKELRVVTEDLDVIPQQQAYASFPDFPPTSNVTTAFSPSMMGKFSPSFISPAESGANYFPMSAAGIHGVQENLNVQSSGPLITDTICAATSTTNSLTAGLGFPFGNIEFEDPNFTFNDPRFFS
ncbi:hypothetical protein SLA2020_102530 [Shorea laevis]